ncbi:MAG: hypothetical protein J0M05_11290 [Candidatus Kapabacteria bacterium]|nr:hypothetical protein [Candidatus Kapabacteria bacterium]
MNNYFDTMSEQLTAYLDGELPIDLHETLFEELARNPQLREEMNEHLLIRSAVQKDNVLPSTRVLDNLLAAVESGETLEPIAHASRVNIAQTLGGHINSFRTLIGSVMALMLGIMAPAIVHESTLRHDNSNILTTADAQQQEAPSNVAESHLPPVSSANLDIAQQSSPQKNLRNAAIVSSIHNDEQPPYQESRAVVNETGAEQISSVLVSAIEFIPIVGSENNASFVANNSNMPAHYMTSASSHLPLIPHDNISVRYRGLGYNGASSNNQWFNNMGIGVFYKLGNNHFLGIDINNERPQFAYEGIVDNRQFTYQQNPSFLSVSLAYRFDAGMIKLGDFHPYAEISGGLALPNMPVGRVGSGIVYSPTQEVSLSLGMEYNTLQYKFLGNTYSSNNWGITYGIMINMDAF